MRERRKRTNEGCRIVGVIPEVGRRKGSWVGRAVEEMVCRGVEGKAIGTDRIVGTADENFEVTQIRAKTGAEAPQSNAGFARKDAF